MNKLQLAITDFENALKIDKTHPNAIKYLNVTLMKIEDEEIERKKVLSGEFLMVFYSFIYYYYYYCYLIFNIPIIISLRIIILQL